MIFSVCAAALIGVCVGIFFSVATQFSFSAEVPSFFGITQMSVLELFRWAFYFKQIASLLCSSLVSGEQLQLVRQLDQLWNLSESFKLFLPVLNVSHKPWSVKPHTERSRTIPGKSRGWWAEDKVRNSDLPTHCGHPAWIEPLDTGKWAWGSSST